MFVLADEEHLRGLLDDAGFIVGRIEDVPVLFTYADVDDYITTAVDTGGMFSRLWAAASDDQHRAIEAGLAERFAEFEVDGRYELPGVAVGASAT